VNLRLGLTLFAREARGMRARLVFFALCLAAGVAAVVAVAGLTKSFREGIQGRARELLAADLIVSARRPLPEELDTLLTAERGAEVTRVRELATLVAAAQGGGDPHAAPSTGGTPGRSQLVELKVVEGTYPFYGTLELAPARPLAELLAPNTVVVGEELLARLGLRRGDGLRVGSAEFQIVGEVVAEPDRLDFSLALGPRIFLSGEGFARAALEKQGSSIRYRALIRMPPESRADATDRFATRLRRGLAGAEYLRIETYADAQPALRRGIQRTSTYLGLVALLSLFLGGIGVAQTVRAWIGGRLDAIAIQKCLGLRPREVLLLYAGQAAWLSLVGSCLGALAGVGLQLVAARWLADLIPPELIRSWQPAAIARGVGLGLSVALAFSLAPLASTLSVAPARVLRRDAEPLPQPKGLQFLLGIALVGGLFGAAWQQSHSLEFGAGFTGGCLALAGVLALASRALMWGAARLPRERFGVLLRHGFAALARPGAGTLGAIVALGLGVLVVLALYLVEGRLSRELAGALPSDAPSAYLIDVQPAQWPVAREILASEGAEHIESVPVVAARLARIDGRSVDDVARDRRSIDEQGGEQAGGRRSRWVLTREQRLTYLRELPKDNQVVEGALWSDPNAAEISLEREFARDLGAHLGTMLTFDIQGVAIDLRVTSIRSIEWRTFGLNFFLVVEPGVLEDAPQFLVASARLRPGSDARVQDRLVQACPNITMIRVREILEKVGGVLARVGLGVRVLGGFTVLAGIAILFGAVSASSVRRSREVALFMALGMTRAGVVAVYAVEAVLIGLVAGLIGAVGAQVLAKEVVERGLELTWGFRPLPTALAVLAAAALSTAAGLAASARALRSRPIEVLRGE
jgi:putative ABC transport system permease protein